MIERDYIMRMIQVLTAALARIVFLKKAKDFPRALLEIQTTGRTLLGVDRTLLRHLSPSQLMEIFGSDFTVAAPKSYVLGILLAEEADVHHLMGEQDEADQCHLKSLCLLIDTLLKSGEPIEPEHPARIDEVIRKLDGATLPPDVQARVFRYLEWMGRFDKAENMLYEVLEHDPGFKEEGLGFYRRLLQKSDSDLQAGNLPRNEVEEGLEHLQKGHS
jgi:hypothetical protein